MGSKTAIAELAQRAAAGDKMKLRLRSAAQRAKEEARTLGVGASVLVGASAAGLIDGKWGNYSTDSDTNKLPDVADYNGFPLVLPVAIAAGISGFFRFPGSAYIGGMGLGAIAYELAYYVHRKAAEADKSE
jgi:hypothetical protein